MQEQEDWQDIPVSPVSTVLAQAQAGTAMGHPQVPVVPQAHGQVAAPIVSATAQQRTASPRPSKPLPVPGRAAQPQQQRTAPRPAIQSAATTEQELERLRAENAELRLANPARVDAAVVQAENVQLRQRARLLENQSVAANHSRQTVMRQARQHADRLAQQEREHGREVLGLRRQVQELERRLAQAPAQAPAALGPEQQDPADIAELQEQLEQTHQAFGMANGMLVSLQDHYHLADDQIEQIYNQWVRRQPPVATGSGQLPAQ